MIRFEKLLSYRKIKRNKSNLVNYARKIFPTYLYISNAWNPMTTLKIGLRLRFYSPDSKFSYREIS